MMHQIAIGYMAQATREREFVLRVPLGQDPAEQTEFRAIMTEDEARVVTGFMRRLLRESGIKNDE